MLQRGGIVTQRELLDLAQERLELGRAAPGQAIVIPGGGRHGRKACDVGGIDARVEPRTIDRKVEIENGGEENDAVQVDARAACQFVGQHRRARGAIAFAKQVLGRIPPPVLAKELLDEAGEGVGIGIDPPERFLLVLARDPAEPRPWRVDEYQVGHIEQ